MSPMTDIDILNEKFNNHLIWDADQHTMLRKEHESDWRSLVQAIADLRITVEQATNKLLLCVVGAALSTVACVLLFVVPHIH